LWSCCTAGRKRGDAFLKAGNTVCKKNVVRERIRHDEEFHHFISELSGNPLPGRTAEIHWRYLRRVMEDVLRLESAPESIWQQHQSILNCILEGNTNGARSRAEEHISDAADILSALTS